MLKRSIAFAIAVTVIPVSYALAADTGPGCGIGTMIWENNKKIIPQVLAATTNGTSGNQTFGITTGTLGCTNDGVVKNDQKVNVFANVNFESLKQEMAQGNGEYLASLATLMGIPTDRQESFFALTQSRYTSLFQSEETTSAEMLVALNLELSAYPVLSQVVFQ